MLSRIFDLFSPSAPPQVSQWERVQLATCVLLLEIAYADKTFSEDERSRIITALKNRFEMSDEEAEELLCEAEEARRESHDLWRFTNQINQHCTPTEKQAIIREIWRVIYSDNTLDSYEDHLVHRMATLLNLTHPQLIEAKLAVLREDKRD